MKKAASPLSPPADLAWLAGVQEVLHPIDHLRPVRVTERRVRSASILPVPTVPFPERHPYCEISIVFQGRGSQFIGSEKIERVPGSLMLVGPGLPHYATITTCPMRVVTAHFLPIVLFEMGPAGDGARLLARFTSPKKIHERVINLPVAARSRLGACFNRLAAEYTHPQVGTESKLRSILIDILVDLLRWEITQKRAIHTRAPSSNWVTIEKALRFIYQHYAEPIYVEQIAREAGLGPKALHGVFHAALGMSCMQYLRSYRISHAAALLRLPDARVKEVSTAVGFETLSHFNTLFHKFLGTSPQEYMQRHK